MLSVEWSQVDRTICNLQNSLRGFPLPCPSGLYFLLLSHLCIFFNILKGCFHIFSLGQHSSLGKPIWPPLSTLSLVLFLFLLSTDSVYHYILGSLCTLVQFDFHPWKQLPYITEPSLPLRVWGHDVVFLRGGMRSLWVTCDDTVFHFLDLSQEQILYVDKNQSPQKISLFIH